MHIYIKLNTNLQNKIDKYIQKTNKILQKQINNEIIIYFFKNNLTSIIKNVKFTNTMCCIF